MRKRFAHATIVAVTTGVAALLMLTADAAPIVEPADTGRGPAVALDQAHGDAATAAAFFRAFADLLTSDGSRVAALDAPFDPQQLAAVDVLVVAAPKSTPPSADERPVRPIGDRECDLVREWVRGGGALLIAAGGPPSANPGGRLAASFGVEAGGGSVFDRVSGGGITTRLDFSRDNGRLGDHAILRGRRHAEQVARIRSPGGQSLSGPRGAALLLKFGPTAREAATRDDLEAEEFAARQEAGIAGSFSIPVAGRAQGLALAFGKGRLVVLGAPELLSAAGLNLPDADNRQFALNVIHWLSRV